MIKNIAIYGAGGLGRETACLINRINEHNSQWNLIGFFDDGKPIGEEISHFGVCIGGINELNSWDAELSVVLAFGSPKSLKMVHKKINNPLIKFPNIIDPSFKISDPKGFSIGLGNIITPGCSVSTNVKLGNFNLLNGENGFGHDTNVGDFNVFMPCVKVSGEVTIGDCNLFGAGSFIKQQLTIGNDITLSPLSALLSKPRDGKTYIGNPARKFEY